MWRGVGFFFADVVLVGWLVIGTALGILFGITAPGSEIAGPLIGIVVGFILFFWHLPRKKVVGK